MNDIQESAPEPITEAALVELYGATEVTRGDLTMPLTQVLRFEAMMCPAPPEKRQDEEKRVKFLAQMLGTEALLPEHQYLLASDPAEQD